MHLDRDLFIIAPSGLCGPIKIGKCVRERNAWWRQTKASKERDDVCFWEWNLLKWKSSWWNFWLSFSRGMVFVQWHNMQWEIKPHVACRKKEKNPTFFNVFSAPWCMIQSETGFSLHRALASRRACPMGVRPRSQAVMDDKCGCAMGWSDPAGLRSGNHACFSRYLTGWCDYPYDTMSSGFY